MTNKGDVISCKQGMNLITFSNFVSTKKKIFYVVMLRITRKCSFTIIDYCGNLIEHFKNNDVSLFLLHNLLSRTAKRLRVLCIHSTLYIIEISYRNNEIYPEKNSAAQLLQSANRQCSSDASDLPSRSINTDSPVPIYSITHSLLNFIFI